MVPFVIAGALMALAFGAHVFVGTRETRSLRPAAHPSSSSVPPSWCGAHLPFSSGAHPENKINILDEDRQGRYIYNCAYEVMFLTTDVVLDYHQSESYYHVNHATR